MIHKAFEVIGERVLIVDKTPIKSFDEKTAKGFEELLKSFERDGSVSADTKRSTQKQKFGIFLESEKFMTDLYGGRAALDFIEPMYNPSSLIEELAKGKIPKERIHPDNPILSICYGIDPLLLNYKGENNNTHVFTGELWYAQGVFYNDGNFEIFDEYRTPLLNAGFKIL